MKFKKFRLIIGISLCVQAITFFILALLNLEKKKALAATFAAIGAAGGVAGGVLIYKEIKDRRRALEEDFDDFDDFDFDDEDIDEDDILCSFDDEDEKEEETENAE
ncbi:MAG: hypothetical protein J5793_00270 [Clostridia bacterium]|nr:hypothetical protein [Clostridia bacterium]